MIVATFLSAFAAFGAPPVCDPRTVTTRPGVPVAVQPDCDQNGTVTVTLPPVAGTLSGFPGQYTPSPGFNGVDHLRYTVTNAGGEVSPETTISLVVNSLPTCANGTATTLVDTPLKLVFPCTDPDGNAVLIRAEDGAHGGVDPDVGTQLTYTPETGFVGEDEISFVGLDGAFQTATRKLVITVTAAATATPTPDPVATPAATAVPTPPLLAAPAADTIAPTVSLKATGKPSIARGVTVAMTSNEAGIATLTLAAGKQKASKNALLRVGTTNVSLRLSAKARKALKRSVKATITATASDAAGNRVTKRLAVTLKR